LSRAGARVLLIDKARFPRDKPCGGGLTFRAVKELPFSVDPVVEDVVDRVTCRLRYGRSFERQGRAALCLMTQRRRLDHYLVEPGVALEGNVRHGVVDRDDYRGRMVIELAVLRGGYGWIFPKGDHVNVGVGGWASEGPRLRAQLRELCLAYDIDPAAVTDIRGHRLPLRRPGTRLARGRALLVGDAAGLVDPVS